MDETDDGIALGTRLRTIVIVDAGTPLLSVPVTCAAGTRLTGGGFSNVQGGLQLIGSHPSGNTWMVLVANPTFRRLSIQAYAQCGVYGPI